MGRNILLKSLGWGILVAEASCRPDEPEIGPDDFVASLRDLGLQGVTEILSDPSGAAVAVILTNGQEPCQIELDLMGPDERSLLNRLSLSYPSPGLRQRMSLLGLTDCFPAQEQHPERKSSFSE